MRRLRQAALGSLLAGLLLLPLPGAASCWWSEAPADPCAGHCTPSSTPAPTHQTPAHSPAAPLDCCEISAPQSDPTPPLEAPAQVDPGKLIRLTPGLPSTAVAAPVAVHLARAPLPRLSGSASISALYCVFLI